MEAITLPHLAELEELRGNPVMLYSSMINDDSVRVLYECLRRLKKTERLDLVLSTVGGPITTARQFALLLREYTQHLTIFVPYRARSAGTLLCLSANELVLGPMAELGPIDPHIGAIGPVPPDAPGMISAQDIRMFRHMAEDWFGVVSEDDRLQVLALVAQRIFPTSLSSFYRSDLMIRQIANELLAYQLPDAKEDIRKQIADQLVGGYYAHDYIISRAEIIELGLIARAASFQEEMLLWDIYLESHKYIVDHPGQEEEEITGLIVSKDFIAVQESYLIDAPAWKMSKKANGNASSPEKIRNITWRIEI